MCKGELSCAHAALETSAADSAVHSYTAGVQPPEEVSCVTLSAVLGCVLMIQEFADLQVANSFEESMDPHTVSCLAG